MRPEGRSSVGQCRGCSVMSSRLRLRPIGALASATIEHLHLLFRHHLVKRQRRGLKIVFRYMRRLEVAIAIFAAYQRGPIPLSHRLLQMRRDIADGEPDAAVGAAVLVLYWGQPTVMGRGLA